MRPFFLFAPGAGALSSHPWMQRWKQRLATIGGVETFDYSYMQAGRRRPDPLKELVATHRRALAELKPADAARTFLIGKSMGGRIGCHVALEDESVRGLVCLGYPLCGGGDRAKLRDEVLRNLRTPILFVQGTRDPLCPLDLLEQVRAEMRAPSTLHLVAGGDHSLAVRKGQLKEAGDTQEEVDGRILDAIKRFTD